MRQAVYQAIDVETLVQDVHRGLAVPVGMLIAPGVNGHTPELGERLPYDPEASESAVGRSRLPAGVHCHSRLPEDWSRARGEALCRFIAPQLAAIGIDVTVNFQPTNQHWAKLGRRETDFFMDGWIEGFDWETPCCHCITVVARKTTQATLIPELMNWSTRSSRRW